MLRHRRDPIRDLDLSRCFFGDERPFHWRCPWRTVTPESGENLAALSSLAGVRRGQTTKLRFGLRKKRPSRRMRFDSGPRYQFPRMNRSRTDRGCKPANVWSPATASRQAAYHPKRIGDWVPVGLTHAQPQNAAMRAVGISIDCISARRGVGQTETAWTGHGQWMFLARNEEAIRAFATQIIYFAG